jgi:hypothetical protein
MALFSLTDIRFNKGNKPRTGAASSSLVGGVYESNIYRYPIDIGNYDKGHYMVIHVNEQIQTDYPGGYSQDDPTIIANRKNFGTPTTNQNLGQALSTLGRLGNNLDQRVTGGRVGQAINQFSNNPSIKPLTDMGSQFVSNASNLRGVRTIRRTTDTIALYMPDTMNFVNTQQYSDLTLGTPGQLLAAGASVADMMKGANRVPAGVLAANLSPFLLNMALNTSNLGRVLSSSALGVVENPMLELLYTSPAFRTFRFDFMFYPRSEKEASEVQDILAKLEFHQAPEIRKESKGFFLVPPSEFDIKFYYNGTENPNIPPISTCVLESIDIDYAPNGYATYEVPGQINSSKGKTGMPVAIRLSLQFKETELMTKDNFADRADRYVRQSTFGTGGGIERDSLGVPLVEDI